MEYNLAWHHFLCLLLLLIFIQILLLPFGDNNCWWLFLRPLKLCFCLWEHVGSSSCNQWNIHAMFAYRLCLVVFPDRLWIQIWYFRCLFWIHTACSLWFSEISSPYGSIKLPCDIHCIHCTQNVDVSNFWDHASSVDSVNEVIYKVHIFRVHLFCNVY